uniref:Cytochrome c oxidase subunit 2 n=1 Tax=Vargula hilgendorfii TaxID=6674 RepID=Q766X1_VARHI|nr:cytochrome c oxidase subunit II [Vargula hilgendorfii]BAD06237.1 cytochrome oxidase subunit 2 [Vargula hilgendorfii]BCO38772.1 cytochrome oxidase subunit 2 [Vargula hilgendorfii]BCO38850.1 cytochrome oxidase subunit 2 [Vargula hilgendorfii]
MSFWSQMGFPDAGTPSMEYFAFFHGYAMSFITLIFVLILYVGTIILTTRYTSRFLLEQQTLETIWTIVPVFMLLFLAVPSLKILYMVEELTSPQVTLKAIGHQWYWTYEYSIPDTNNPEYSTSTINFDSYMLPESALLPQDFRNYEVDHRPLLPSNTQCRVLTTSTDVIHAWGVPSFGVKADALPGRINQIPVLINAPGIYYGSCMELCGTNHSFMPIVVEAHPLTEFNEWIN